MKSTARSSSRTKGLVEPTVWGEFSPLAVEHDAYNLGQGFPDWPCPDFCKNAVKNAVENNFNQYCRSAGHMPLVQTLAEQYSKSLNRKIDFSNEVTVSVGATEGMFAIWQAFLNPGDEVVIFEPTFDVYKPQIESSGGKCVFVPLRPNSEGKWVFDINELRNAFSDRTRAVLLNTPHNPTGKVFTVEEIKTISDIMDEYSGIILVTDEVYEKIVFEKDHTYPASVEGMWEKTLMVSSAGKTFSTTGWKIGWVIGPSELVLQVVNVNQWIQYCVPTLLQQAVADSLKKALEPYKGHSSYYEYLRSTYQNKREKLVKGLEKANIETYLPEGGIFVIGNIGEIREFKGEVKDEYMKQSTPASKVMTHDWAFCRWMTIEKKVTAIPCSAFYEAKNKHLASSMVRFAFCKSDDTIDGAIELLLKLGVK